MKAVAYRSCETPAEEDFLFDVVKDRPVATGRDCLIEIRAIAVNPVDIKIRTSVQPGAGEDKILGWDACGVISAVGDQVTGYKPGDEVWYAGVVNRPGSNAEFQLVDERLIGLKPKSLSFSEAAALPLTSLTAWEILFDRLEIERHPEQHKRLLITGAAGGVGSIMTQLASRIGGCEVIATASREETRDWVISLGASHVISHHQPLSQELQKIGIASVSHVASLTHTDQHFDELVKALQPQGRLALIDSPIKPLNIVSMKQKSLSLHWEFMFTRGVFQTNDMIQQQRILNRVSQLVDDGVIRSTMKQHFGVINAQNLIRAHRFIDSNTSIGKVVLESFE